MSMRFKAVLTSVLHDKRIIGVGYTREDWNIQAKKFSKHYRNKLPVSAQIDKWEDYKSNTQLGLFHKCVRRISVETKMDFDMVRTSLMQTYGVWEDNPLYRKDKDNPVPREVLKSMSSYTWDEMSRLIKGLFMEGEWLRQHGYPELDLYGQYEEYLALRRDRGKV